MRPEESFINQPIRSLQTMLRILAADEGRKISLVPDGIYGRQTAAEVSAFQRRHGLPVTGVTDLDTWEAIVRSHEPARIRQYPAQPLEVILNPGQVIRSGEFHPNIFLAQGMLTTLAGIYSSITQPGFSGYLDLPTVQALESFQALSALPMTGELDKITWKHLSHHYPLASNLLLSARNN